MRTLTLMVSLALPLLTPACDLQQSPKEEAREVGEAIQDGEDLGDISDEVGDVVEASGDKAEDAIDDLGDKAEDATDEAKDKAEEAVDKAEEMTDGDGS